MGGTVKPLDPGTVASVVRYGLAADSLVHEATGDALVYSQLYPFEGLQNYTSGIIHHVRLQGDRRRSLIPCSTIIFLHFFLGVQ